MSIDIRLQYEGGPTIRRLCGCLHWIQDWRWGKSLARAINLI